MRLISVTISGYRQFLAPMALEIPDGITGVSGPNGVGKSKLIEAIGYGLFGPSPYVLPGGDKATDLPSKAQLGAVPTVQLVIEIAGQQYEIYRSSKQAYIRLCGSKDNLAETKQALSKKVIELLGLSPAAYVGTFVARQNDIAGLQTLNDTNRKRLVNRLIGIEQVELAIKFAHEHTVAARAGLGEQRRLLTISSEIARQVLEQEKATLKACRDEAEAYHNELMAAAQRRYEEALADQDALNQRLAQVELYSQGLRGLHKQQETLATHLETARQQIEAGARAKIKLAKHLETIAGTSHVEAELKQQETLANAAILQESLDRQSRELRRLRPILLARQTSEKALEKLNKHIDDCQARLGTCSEGRARAQGLLDQADIEIKACEERKTAIIESEEVGVCNLCGRPFDDIEGSLIHYVDELALAYRQMALADACLDQAASAEKAANADLASAKNDRLPITKQLQKSITVPGEVKRLEQEIDRLTNQLTDLLLELGSSNDGGIRYDPIAHQQLRELQASRNQALGALQDLRDQVSAGKQEKATASRLEQEIAEATRRQKELRALISLVTVEPELEQKTTDEVQQAKADLDVCHQEELRLSESIATLAERVRNSEQKLLECIRREEQITAAERSSLIAERTEQVLGQLLVDINSSALPIITDYMDSWVRSLIGLHFQRVVLTNDYKVMADNGSGLHGIEHFSGGEQTLLAIMLRVAISMYCQEHAGIETGFLVLDEVFGNQDSEHRSQLVQFLTQIKERYSQIIVVNHIEAVTDMLDSVIEVERTGPNTSAAWVRR